MKRPFIPRPPSKPQPVANDVALDTLYKQVDHIDQAVITLVAQRLEITCAAARIDADSLEYPGSKRQQRVFAHISALAESRGLPIDIAQGMFEMMMIKAFPYEREAAINASKKQDEPVFEDLEEFISHRKKPKE